MLARGLTPGADAPGAQVEAVRGAIDRYGCRLDIGQPGPAGVPLGMAYPVTETQCFTTFITRNSQI